MSSHSVVPVSLGMSTGESQDQDEKLIFVPNETKLTKLLGPTESNGSKVTVGRR
jgi:hypothetical protein